MQFIIDMHTHTLASGHAYSTLFENAMEASKKGIRLLGITDHAPSMKGTTHPSFFNNFSVIPREQFGVEIFMGAELNICDYEGRVDLPREVLERFDIAIASLHPPCIDFGTVKENTSALLGAMENPNIHIIGHPGDPRYPLDVRAVVAAADRTHTILEINNASLYPDGFRKGSDRVMGEILLLCKEKSVPVLLGSDAHYCTHIGDFGYAVKLLEETGFPEELVLNQSVEELKAYLKK